MVKRDAISYGVFSWASKKSNIVGLFLVIFVAVLFSVIFLISSSSEGRPLSPTGMSVSSDGASEGGTPYLIIAAVVIVVIGIVVVFLLLVKEIISPKDKLTGLKNFIKEARLRKLSDDKIKEMLKDNNWSEDLIRKGFAF